MFRPSLVAKMNKRLLNIIFLLIPVFAFTQKQEKEGNVKAAFIYNFTRYVDWEKNSSDDPFIIGILGSSYVHNPLIEIAKSKLVGTKRIIIKSFDSPDQIQFCHILFIPDKCPHSIRSILDNTGKGTLTISETPGYAKQGTAFNFVIQNDKVKFEANLKAIYLAGLKASSQLLKLAIIVD